MRAWPWARSLRVRLLGATLVTLSLALVGAHGWLTSLFRDHVLQQFDLSLVQQLDQLTARLEFDAEGRPQIGRGSMTDPRWEQPYAGLYWQIEPLAGGPPDRRPGVLRSRSLWDTELRLPADALADGELHRHDTLGPRGEALRAVERSLHAGEPAASRWRLIVAGDLRAWACCWRWRRWRRSPSGWRRCARCSAACSRCARAARSTCRGASRSKCSR